MGFLKSFDQSPEAMAAGLAEVRQELEAQLGHPLVAFIPGLTAPGTLERVIFGWGVSRKGHRVTGGATDRKNRFGLLAVTPDGWLRLYRTKASRGRWTVEEQVRAWAPGGAQVRLLREDWVVGIAVFDPTDEPLAFEMVSTEAAITYLVEPFAAQVGVRIEEER